MVKKPKMFTNGGWLCVLAGWMDGGRRPDSTREPCVFRKVRASTERESSCSDLGKIYQGEREAGVAAAALAGV